MYHPLQVTLEPIDLFVVPETHIDILHMPCRAYIPRQVVLAKFNDFDSEEYVHITSCISGALVNMVVLKGLGRNFRLMHHRLG